MAIQILRNSKGPQALRRFTVTGYQLFSAFRHGVIDEVDCLYDARRRLAAVGIGLFIVAALVVLTEYVVTIRVGPDLSFPSDYALVRTAYPGQLISIDLGRGWSEVVTSNPAVTHPLTVTSNPTTARFIALSPGQATLHATSIPCPGCLTQTFLWRMTVNVRMPGT